MIWDSIKVDKAKPSQCQVNGVNGIGGSSGQPKSQDVTNDDLGLDFPPKSIGLGPRLSLEVNLKVRSQQPRRRNVNDLIIVVLEKDQKLVHRAEVDSLGLE